MERVIDNLEQLPRLASDLLEEFREERFFAFFGKMGVGKTTLIKALCDQLGVKEVVCSPTFAIINEYTSGEGEPVYHFDFYRLKSAEEAYDIGYEAATRAEKKEAEGMDRKDRTTAARTLCTGGDERNKRNKNTYCNNSK